MWMERKEASMRWRVAVWNLTNTEIDWASINAGMAPVVDVKISSQRLPRLSRSVRDVRRRRSGRAPIIEIAFPSQQRGLASARRYAGAKIHLAAGGDFACHRVQCSKLGGTHGSPVHCIRIRVIGSVWSWRPCGHQNRFALA